MLVRPLHRLIAVSRTVVCGLRRRLLAATRPAAAPVAAGALVDLARSRPALVVENALLRHQLAILRRSTRRPRCTPADRALLVLLASRVRTWRSALLIVQPETLLRWHRQLFRALWWLEMHPSTSCGVLIRVVQPTQDGHRANWSRPAPGLL